MPEIISTAPGRCGIIGNPTDMYGGSVISCTTRERAQCRLIIDSEQSMHAIILTNEDEHMTLNSRADLQQRGDKLDIARAVLTYFKIDPAEASFALHLHTKIPMRAGLAGSTALLATMVGAMNVYLGLRLNRYALAETTRKIEAHVMQVTCGLQDQHMTVFGGLNYMDFARKESLEQRDDEPLATVEPLSLWMNDVLETPPFLLANTGVQHHSGTVHQSPRQRWLSGEVAVIEGYRRIAELARRGKRALVEQDWQLVGHLMNENHRIVAELGGSGPANEHLIRVANDAGALGAKLAGAGGGGTILVLTHDPDRMRAVLTEAGASRILVPCPQPGLTVTTVD